MYPGSPAAVTMYFATEMTRVDATCSMWAMKTLIAVDMRRCSCGVNVSMVAVDRAINDSWSNAVA